MCKCKMRKEMGKFERNLKMKGQTRELGNKMGKFARNSVKLRINDEKALN